MSMDAEVRLHAHGSSLVSTSVPHNPQGFHWKRALFESFVFLSIEQGYVVHDDYRWVVVENGVPFNPPLPGNIRGFA